MWDARFDSIRDRKLNELVIFSAMVRTDPSKREDYKDIVFHLFRDLEVLDALQDDKPVPKSEPIISPLYRGRLSKYESLDEYVLDQCRKEEYVDVPIPSLKDRAPQERLEPPEEVERIAPAESMGMIESPEIPQKIEPPVAQQSIQSPEIPQKIEPPVAQQSIEAPEIPQKIEPPEESQKLQAPAEQAAGEEQDRSDFTFELVISIDDAVTLKRVKEMKDSKIDHFIDEETSGHIKEVACESVIAFLKNDILLIDKILGINVSSKTGIEESLRDIVQFVENADEPKYQKVYLNSLNRNEKDLEGEYNNVLRRLEGVIHDRYPHVMKETHSVFFEE
jgi:hypothetical protein